MHSSTCRRTAHMEVCAPAPPATQHVPPAAPAPPSHNQEVHTGRETTQDPGPAAAALAITGREPPQDPDPYVGATDPAERNQIRTYTLLGRDPSAAAVQHGSISSHSKRERERGVEKKSRGPSRHRPCLPPVCRHPALAAARQRRRGGRSVRWAERRRPSRPVRTTRGPERFYPFLD